MSVAGSSNIAHTAVTDHRILRKPDTTKAGFQAPRKLRPNEIPLVHFHRDHIDIRNSDNVRDLGIALVEIAAPLAVIPLAEMALPMLETSLNLHPDDFAAWEAKASLLFILHKDAEAMTAYETVLSRIPDRETSLIGAATLAMVMDRKEAAVNYWRRAVAVDPWRSDYHVKLASVLMALEKWQEAAVECEAALKLNPADVEMRKLAVECYRRSGEKEKERKEAEILRRWLKEKNDSP
jgi:tetratricopeptide (TPR) repeat protein